MADKFLGEGDTIQFEQECPHYKRGCSFVSPCCGKIYRCRLCHDAEEEFSHTINRFSVQEIICRKCYTKQPVSEKCCKCDLIFGSYYCSVCRLYDNEDKGQFHCVKCGLCRIGGRENFYHCNICGYCLAKDMMETHKCRQDCSKDNCPLCMEDIHTARDPAHVPKCGHLLHTECYKNLLKQRLYRCPQCQKSLVDMKDNWKAMDLEIDNWEMPQHLKDFKVKVKCRDCSEETETTYHIIGLKCTHCTSYNTVRNGNEEIPEDAIPVRRQEFMEQYVQRRNEQVVNEDDED